MTSGGLYGISFELPAEAAVARFVEALPTWPVWRVTTALGPTAPAEQWDSDRAVLWMRPEGSAYVDRVSRSSRLVLPAPPPPEAWAHPLLSLTAAAAATWAGQHAFHAGAFQHDGRAWLVCADSDAGKSSFLCWLAMHGSPIITDDLAVVAAGRVMAGPRCLDLRAGAAEHFSIGTDIGVVGARQRWRVGLPPVGAESVLGGWITLAWGDGVAVETMTAPERMANIVSARALRVAHADTAEVLDLLSAPALRFTRPRDWRRADEAMTTLLASLPVAAAQLG